MTPQIDAAGHLRHLLTLDGLPRPVLERLLERAEALHPHAGGGIAVVRVVRARSRREVPPPAEDQEW